VRLMLTPGDGVAGVIFTQFPPAGPFPNATAAVDKRRTEGQRAWNALVRSLPHEFPGRVMYLPMASSVLLDGAFTPWLPASPMEPKEDWVRVRQVDNVHFCPAGVVRYSAALLSDLTDLFKLPTAQGHWWAESWTADPIYNAPPGSCPDDHPT